MAVFEEEYKEVMSFVLKYLVLPVALVGALHKILNQQKVERFKLVRELWEAGTHAITVSAFLTQFLFFLVTEIERRAANETSEPIYISDWAAWSIIGVGLTVGDMDGLRKLFTEEMRRDNRHAENVERQGCSRFSALLKRGLYFVIAGNVVSRVVLTGIAGAAYSHEFVGAVQKSIG